MEIRIRFRSAASLLVAALFPFVPAWAGSGPDFSINQSHFPDDDAVILQWEQSWTLEKDIVRRRDHKWVRLFNQRAIRVFADPRLDFAAESDTLTVHKAQTILPNGEIVAVPQYSFNDTGPDDTAGWPEYAAWRQKVVSFSAIEPGAVVELDYEVVSPAGSWPWLEADLRLNEDYPTVRRIISVSVPDGVTLHHQLDGLDESTIVREDTRRDGQVIHRWSLTKLSSDRAEEQSPSWQERGGRLRFTTCQSLKEWAGTWAAAVERSGTVNDAIKRFAEDAAKDEPNQMEQIRKLSKKLRDTFTVVNSPKALRGLTCRDAGAVLASSYGNPLESSALLAAAIQSLGIETTLRVAADAVAWKDTVPTVSAFAGVVVVADCGGQKVMVHPEHGVVASPGAWGRKLLFEVDDPGSLRKSYVEARGENLPSDMEISGKLVISADHKAAGELRFTLTGAFFDPAQLETADAQKALVGKLVGRIVPGFEVSSHSVAELSSGVFRVTAAVAGKEPLSEAGHVRVLPMGEGPVFLAEFPMPLNRSYRRTDVRLNGRFRERCDLLVELPGKTECVAAPNRVQVTEAWGLVQQDTELKGKEVRIRRRVEVNMESVPAGSFSTLREAVNDLRTGVLAYRAAQTDPRLSAAE